jgi:hypothetical protein
MSTEPPEELESTHEKFCLWAGVLAGPIAWVAHQQICYTLAGWVAVSERRAVLYAVTLACLALVASGGAMAWRNVRLGGGADDAGGDARARTRFMGLFGLLGCVVFGIVILAQTIPAVWLFPAR